MRRRTQRKPLDSDARASDKPGAVQSTFSTRLINFLASSDISRPVWEPLQARCVDYQEEEHKAMRHGSDVIVIATGTKP